MLCHRKQLRKRNYSMKSFSFIIIALFINSQSCTNNFSKYKEEISTANRLINKIKESDTSEIKKMFGSDPKEIGLTDDRILILIEAVNISLKQAGIKEFKNYKFHKYPKDSPNLVDIILPISQSNGCEEYITVSFVKFIEKSKIYNFDITKCIYKNLDDLVPPSKNTN